MPLYEYCCEECDTHHEEWQGINDDPTVTCASCGKDSLIRIIGSTSFRLKGSDWYAPSETRPYVQRKKITMEGGKAVDEDITYGDG